MNAGWFEVSKVSAKPQLFTCPLESKGYKAISLMETRPSAKYDPGFPSAMMSAVESGVFLLPTHEEQWPEPFPERWVPRDEEWKVIDAEYARGSFFFPVDTDRYSCIKLIYELPDAALPETIETLTELRDHYRSLENPSIRRPTPPPKENVRARVLSVE